jgi:anti-sigma regulatory factor (Ser/Thr protein kinase)
VGRTASGVRGPSGVAATHRGRDTDLELESVPGADAAAAGTVSRALPADLTAVREARTVVQQVLGTWRADEIYDDVALVASELVANALRHGLQGERSPRRFPARLPAPERAVTEPEAVRISLVSTGSHVICAVTDPSGDPPVRQSADPLAGSGRGLQLVESLSLCWGWTVLDGDPDGSSAGAVHGKSVWAIFPLDLPVGRPRRHVVGAA